MKIYLEDKDYQYIKSTSKNKSKIDEAKAFLKEFETCFSFERICTANSDINAICIRCPEIKNIKDYKNKV